MSKPRLLTVASATLAVLAFLPARAHALEPRASLEVVAGAQDVPDSFMLALQPRLVLRLDGGGALGPYVRLGANITYPGGEDSADGHAVDGATGAELHGCKSAWSLCAGVRLGVGLQYADYDALDSNPDSHDHDTMYNAFAELHPYVAWHGVSLGVDARVHRTLDLVAGDDTPRRQDDDEARFALGVSLGYQF
jgi:hypothetical protein